MTASDYATNKHGEPMRSVCVSTDLGKVFLARLTDRRLEVSCKGHVIGHVEKLAPRRWRAAGSQATHLTRHLAVGDVAQRWADAHGGQLPQSINERVTPAVA